MADTHGYHRKAVVPAGDVLVHAGDLTQRGTPSQVREVADFLRAQPHRHKVVIAGNRHLERVNPQVHLSGHIHEDRGEWRHGPTRVINVSTSECDEPCTVIDLELPDP